MANTNKGLKWWFPVFTLIFLSMGTSARLPYENREFVSLYNDTLSCLIVPGDVHRKKQYSTGYHYQILREFVKEQNGFLNLTTLPDSLSLWDALLEKTVRLLVLDANRDTIPEYMEDLVIAGPSLNSKDHVWVYLKEDFEIMQVMNTWFNSFKHTSKFANITFRFQTGKGNHNSDPIGGIISPYDDLIRKYSQTIGWDWRLLAALVYQESTFRMNATSGKGAVGLMQVMPSTAEKFGFGSKELFDPEENIKAGTLYLKEITRQLRDSLVFDAEHIKFILAAYNAGPEQVRICKTFASTQGKDPAVWNDVAEVIPLMRKSEYAHLFTRRFKGDETIRYVDEVLARYERYCEFLN